MCVVHLKTFSLTEYNAYALLVLLLVRLESLRLLYNRLELVRLIKSFQSLLRLRLLKSAPTVTIP